MKHWSSNEVHRAAADTVPTSRQESIRQRTGWETHLSALAATTAAARQQVVNSRGVTSSSWRISQNSSTSEMSSCTLRQTGSGPNQLLKERVMRLLLAI